MRNFFVLMVLGIGMLACDTASAQVFGRRDVNVNANGVRVEVDRRVFGRDQVRVNGVRVDNRRRDRGRDINVNVATGFAPAAVFVPSGFHHGVRFNAFGTRTKVDGFGNVFEVDAFGNARFAGNNFNRGFQGTVFRSQSFHSVGVVPFCH